MLLTRVFTDYRSDAVAHGPPDWREDGGRRQGLEAREVTACRLNATDGAPDARASVAPEKVVEKVEIMEALAYHALWS